MLKKIISICFISILIFTSCSSPREFTKSGNVVVFLYHTLLPANEPPENTLIFTNAKKFEEDIQTLINLGYNPISLYDIYENKADRNKKYFAITFDDGYLSNYEIAFPILQKYGCYADIFINTANEYMEHHFSFAQALEMEKTGLVKIHSHFPDHVDTTKLSGGDFGAMLEASFETLEKEIGKRKYRFFAYPYGFYDGLTVANAHDCGVSLQFIQEYKDSVDNDMIIRTNVPFDKSIEKIIETAYFN